MPFNGDDGKVLLKGFCVLLMAGVLSAGASADQLRIAVASNFKLAMNSLVDRFEQQTDHDVVVSYGSSGKLYAQIQNGAPFDIFFSADSERPQKLVSDGRGSGDSLMTYALGQLVLWSPNKVGEQDLSKVLQGEDVAHIAIANPKLAPYGRAAQQVLEHFQLWFSLQDKLVRGENINQTFLFVRSTNAELAFVALAQVKNLTLENRGTVWQIPKDTYQPIEQQALILNRTDASDAFWQFLQTSESRQMILDLGYRLPPATP